MPRFNVPPVWQQHLPSSFTPTPDWQPDPSWGIPSAGWALWVDETTGYPAQPPAEYASNPYLNISVIPGAQSPQTQAAPVSTSATAADSSKAKKPLGKGAKIGIGVAAVVVFGAIVGSCGGGEDTTSPAGNTTPASAEATESKQADAGPQSAEPVAAESETPAPAQEPEPEPEPEVVLPKTQKSFADRVAEAGEAYDATDNELKASKAIMDRDKALCKITDGSFKEWKATVHDVGSTNDGYGYIAVLMEDDIELSTWNNALSDVFDETLIKPDNKLYDVLLELSSGDEVTVSGKFVKGSDTCVSTSNMTEVLNASSPDFKVDFSSITVE